MPSVYTFTQKTPGSNSNFNNSPRDGARDPIQYANGPQTVDISGTPVVSPATVSNAGVTTLTVPKSAARVSFIALTNTVNVSEADATVATKYFTIPTGVVVTVDVAKCSLLYLKANTGASTLSFWFDVI